MIRLCDNSFCAIKLIMVRYGVFIVSLSFGVEVEYFILLYYIIYSPDMIAQLKYHIYVTQILFYNINTLTVTK